MVQTLRSQKDEHLFDYRNVQPEMKKQAQDSLQIYCDFQMQYVESILGYAFKRKSLLVEALTHKSFFMLNQRQKQHLKDYERLEFLGDTILSFLIARYYFSLSDGVLLQQPSELHQMTTLASTNAMFNLIVIESGIHNYI